MSRRLAMLVALALAAPSATVAQAPAPAVHPGTRLEFPGTLGPAQFARSFTYPIGRATAYRYNYVAGGMEISVQLYDEGRRVPAGGDNPAVVNQFAEEMQGTDRSFRSSGFANVDRPTVPSQCTYGTARFRCIVYTVSGQSGRLFSKMLLTGYRDQYLKIRIDWPQASRQTVADADKTLAAFIAALLR
ncbi:MAG: hypothetical protein KIT25_23895 [Enhydrobacter sp.]|nr:MAG: hypothetical protein KIT25_23895 [Enhydrobacter sp.]